MGGSAARRLLVTGAGGGAGEYVARRLLERGDHLLLVSRDEDRLRALEAELGSNGQLDVMVADVCEPEQADAAAARAKESFGGLDGLVALAGHFQAGTPVALAEPAVYEQLYRANLLSAAVATRSVLRQLEGPGWLVFLSSLLAEEPMPSMGPYAASKAALGAWVGALSREVSARGVHANVIMTTLIDSPKTRAEHPGADYGQWVPVQHVAETVAFLTSDAAESMYGGEVRLLGTFALQAPPSAVAMGPPPGVGGPPPGMGGPPPGMGGPPPAGTSKRYALLYPFKPGMAAEADELFKAGGDPPPPAAGSTRLLSTTVFRMGDTVVRTFEIDGSIEEAIENMVQAAELSDLGARLKPLMQEGVDPTTAEGLRRWFHSQMMEIVTDRAIPGR